MAALYVGLDGSGEVLKLMLPGMTLGPRRQLPVDPSYGQLVPDALSVSPLLDDDVIAISVGRTTVTPRHAGVFLARDGVLQPRATPDHIGSNLVVFDAGGQYLYGYDSMTDAAPGRLPRARFNGGSDRTGAGRRRCA